MSETEKITGVNQAEETELQKSGLKEETELNKSGEVKAEPYKVFSSKEEFDKHSAGILGNAKIKAEKELLAMLGLKLDEKDKLAKFKEAYDSTLSEAEKQAENLEKLNGEVKTLQTELAEKNAVILALSKSTGKDVDNVSKLVKMARGLVDENTTIDDALSQVFDLIKPEVKVNTTPKGEPLNEGTKTESNPFKDGNLTKQGELIKTDRNKARELYTMAFGKKPNW